MLYILYHTHADIMNLNTRSLSLVAKIITPLLAVSWSSWPMKLGMEVRLYPMSWHIWRDIRSHLRVQPWRISSIRIRSRNSALAVPMIHPARQNTSRPTQLNVKGTVIIVLAEECSTTFAASDNSLLGFWFRTASGIFGLLKGGFELQAF